MKRNFTIVLLRLSFILGLSFFAFSHSFSQTVVSGTVFEAGANVPLPAASVIIKGTTTGTISNLDGEYRFTLKAGTYTLIASYVGFEDLEKEVTISEGQLLKVDFSLKAHSIMGEEVVVTAQARGQLGAINRQLNANSVMNAVSKDRLQELPDANVAESVGRISGVSVRRNAGEANKIVIRGLEPKLNAITVNGVKMPSTEGDRSVDLSMISSEMLEAVEVFKATTPDMDAEAIGGVVNLKIKKAPEERSTIIKLDGGYNNLRDDFSNYKVFGQFSQRFFDNKFGLIANGFMEKVNRSSESYRADYRIDGVRDTITGIVPIKGRNTDVENVDEKRKRYGASVTLDYKYDNGVIWISNFFSQTSRDIFSVRKEFDADEDANVVYSVNDRQLDLSGLSSSINGEHNVLNMDIDWVLSRYHTQTNDNYDWQMQFHEDGRRTTDSARVFDDSAIAGEPLTWPGAARNDLNYTYLRNAYMRPDTTKQTDYTAELNIEIPISLGSKIGGFLKFGGKYIHTSKDRTASGRGEDFYYMGANTDYVRNAQNAWGEDPLIINDYMERISALNFVESETGLKDIVNDEYELFPIFDRNLINKWYDTQKSILNNDRTPLRDEYSLTETITAGYMMAKLNVGQKLTIIPGVRYEYSDNQYNAIWSTANGSYGADGIQKDTSTTKAYGHFFPHFHTKFKPVKWLDFRFSVNKTLARPNYNWISPRSQISANHTSIRRGNPDLIESKSWNYELAASLYSNKIGLFTIGGFYKDISDIFYEKRSIIVSLEEGQSYQIPGGGVGYTMHSYANSDYATVYGLEVDLQTQLKLLTFLPKFLKGIVMNANYTRVWSETAYPDFKYKQIIDHSTWPPTVTIEYEELERRGSMPGQSEHIFNISLGYDAKRFSARASVLYQGTSISSLGEIAESDSWNDDYWRYDASLKYKLNDVISFHANFSNITGQPDRTYFGSAIYQTRRAYYGMTASLGVQIKL